MATPTASSSSLTRYPRWVWALTGLTTAYFTYTIWTIYSGPGNQSASNNSSLQRRRAIRAQRRRSPRQEQQLSSSTIQASRQQESLTDDVTSPFGTITAQVNDRKFFLFHLYTLKISNYPHRPTHLPNRSNSSNATTATCRLSSLGCNTSTYIC